MKVFAGVALIAAALAVGGCQSTGGSIDPALVDWCATNGFGRPGQAGFDDCARRYSMAGRGEQLDKRLVGANGT